MSLTQNTANSRMVYENAWNICVKNNIDPVAAKLTQTVIRLEQTLNTTQSLYTFPVTTVSNAPAGTLFPSERRLNQQDSFIVSSLGVYLAEPASANTVAYIDYTYPSPSVFSNTGEAAGLETIYKASMKITVNNTVICPSYHFGWHRLVPQSQKVAAGTNQNGIAYDQIDAGSDGRIPIEPNWILIGSKNNLIEVSLPAALPAVGTAGFTRLILEFRGILAQNSTIIT